MKKYFFTILLFIGCSSPKKVITNYHDENKNVNLFAFVGKKISVTKFDPNLNNKTSRKEIDEETGDSVIVTTTNYIMDSGFRCKYKVVKQLFNSVENDTVEFVAYDHYGRPGFEKPEFVLLYISKNKDGNYFHQKYQYDALKLEPDGSFSGHVLKLDHGIWSEQKKKASLKELFEVKKKRVFKDLFKNGS